MDIKPIETVYNGYRFRSRLEARWAVFFDTLGLKWEYEKEGFDLGDGVWYLPDFWLDDVRMWAEVKPDKLTPSEYDKAKRLVLGTRRSCLMLIGVPEDKPYYAIDAFPGCQLERPDWKCPNLDPESHWPGVADECDACPQATTVTYNVDYCLTNYHEYPRDEHRFYSQPGGDCDSHWEDTARAAAAAKAARFERHVNRADLSRTLDKVIVAIEAGIMPDEVRELKAELEQYIPEHDHENSNLAAAVGLPRRRR